MNMCNNEYNCDVIMIRNSSTAQEMVAFASRLKLVGTPMCHNRDFIVKGVYICFYKRKIISIIE